MIINDLDGYQLVRILLSREYMLQRDLVEQLNIVNGKNTKQSNFSCKLKRNHLSYRDLQQICEILGYDLIVKKKGEQDVH